MNKDWLGKDSQPMTTIFALRGGGGGKGPPNVRLIRSALRGLRYSPGVKSGEQAREKSPPARISLLTSPSQPSLTPSIIPDAKKVPLIGVGRIPQVEGGLLLPLRGSDKAGVAGSKFTLGVMHCVFNTRWEGSGAKGISAL